MRIAAASSQLLTSSRLLTTGRLLTSSLAVPAALAWALAVPACAEDFRVDTKVFQGKELEPISTNVTRFHGSVIWDFSGGGGEIMMYDKPHGRFAVIDLRRKIKVEVPTDTVLQFTQQLRDWAASQQDPLLKFCSAPRLERTAGEAPDSLLFTGSMLNYEVDVQRPPKPEFATAYREFSDWSARLNSLLHPGVLPPFPRLVVNEQLSRDGVIPRQVRLTVSPQRAFGNKELKLHSEHEVRYMLSQSDLTEMDSASRALVTFRKVSLDEYRKQDETATAKR